MRTVQSLWTSHPVFSGAEGSALSTSHTAVHRQDSAKGELRSNGSARLMANWSPTGQGESYQYFRCTSCQINSCLHTTPTLLCPNLPFSESLVEHSSSLQEAAIHRETVRKQWPNVRNQSNHLNPRRRRRRPPGQAGRGGGSRKMVLKDTHINKTKTTLLRLRHLFSGDFFLIFFLFPEHFIGCQVSGRHMSLEFRNTRTLWNLRRPGW